MDDTTGDDIKLKIDEYATMSDVKSKTFHADNTPKFFIFITSYL